MLSSKVLQWLFIYFCEYNNDSKYLHSTYYVLGIALSSFHVL